MPQQIDIQDLIRWIDSGMRPVEFFRIFNLPSQVYPEIHQAISFLGDLISAYSDHFGRVSVDPTLDKKESFLKLLFADIFGEIAISIKLAAEGYIKYSLRGLRASLDMLFAGLYTVDSWTEGSLSITDGVNPLAEAFFSGFWSRLEEVDIDQLVLSRMYFKDGDKENPVRRVSLDLANSFVEQLIEKFGFDKSKIPKMSGTKLIIRSAIEKGFSEMLKTNESETWANLQRESFLPENFLSALMLDERFCFRACKEHEQELINRLVNALNFGEVTNEQIQEVRASLTFLGPEYDQSEHWLTCDDCEKPARTFGLHVRPNSRMLLKLIKYQMPTEKRKGLDSCVSDLFSGQGKESKGYFGDLIYSNVYVKLNDFSHSNVIGEPTMEEWLDRFVIPVLGVCDCMLGTLPDSHAMERGTDGHMKQ